jgi:hypothetical protein
VQRSGLELAAGLPKEERAALMRGLLTEGSADQDVLSGVLSDIPGLGNTEDVDILLRFGRGQDNSFLVVGTIEARGQIEERLGTQSSLTWFRELLRTENSPDVVLMSVAGALRRIGDETFLPLLAARLRICPDDGDFLARELSHTISLLLGRRLHGPGFARAD